MNRCFKINTIKLALCLVFPALGSSAQADPYPSVPATLAPAVKPNILLHVDNSGSMGSYVSGTRNTRMTVAKEVAVQLITDNRDLNWGLFSFGPTSSTTYSNEGGHLVAKVLPIDSAHETNFKTLKDAIDSLTASTNTPLGEAMIEMTRVWAGEPSYYLGSGTLGKSNAKGKATNMGSNGTYESPIKYRCQRNFNIVITDGEPTQDSTHAGIASEVVPGSDPQLNYNDGITWRQRDVPNGPLVSKNFKVCQNKDTVSFIGCDPHTYESKPTATKNYSTGGAVQDAAKYAYMRDFKVDGIHGVDGDNKSWDDPKFERQNVFTYTVGFAADVVAMSSAAKVGHGKYYTATDKDQLTKALNNAVSEIGNIVSNAGGVAPSGSKYSTATKLFQPLFHPTGWYGELLCYQLNGRGEITQPCVPNAGAVIPAATARNIHTAKVSGGVTTSFTFAASSIGSMTAEQQSALGRTDAERKNVVNYIRGQAISGFRPRPNGLLGDIIDGKPLVIGEPLGSSGDSDYPSFKEANSNRSLVFIGANDGMLHGFAASNMEEFFGYVPSVVYPRLKRLTDSDYGIGAANPHTYYVNGDLRQQDVKLDGIWKTLLVGGLAQGGQGYFGLNATNSATSVMWEFTDQADGDLGYTFGTPVIYNVRSSLGSAEPVVIVANGYKSNYADDDAIVGNNKSTLYILNAGTGSLRKKITASTATETGGLSSPVGVDYPANGVLDYIYAGDQSGKLWRFDLTSDNLLLDSTTVVPHLVFDAGSGHPIIQRPVVRIVRDSAGTYLGNLVIFGTGSLLEGGDRLDTRVQTLYGILDKRDGTTTVNRSDLIGRTVEVGTRDGSTYRKVSTEDTPETTLRLTDPDSIKLGWYLDLPVLSERLASTPILLSDRVLFGTGIPNTQEVCTTGNGWLMGLDPLTGSIVKGSRDTPISFIDVHEDGKTNNLDKVDFSGVAAYVSGIELGSIPTELSVVTDSITFAPLPADDPLAAYASNIALYEQNAMGVFRASSGDGGSGGSGEAKGQGSTVFVTGLGDKNITRFFGGKEGTGIVVETTIWREIK